MFLCDQYPCVFLWHKAKDKVTESTVIWKLMLVLVRNRHRALQRNSVTSNLDRCIVFRSFRRNSVVAKLFLFVGPLGKVSLP